MDALKSFEQEGILFHGNENAVENLAQKECATIAVVSDSHGDTRSLAVVLKNIENCDALVFCGDGVSDCLSLLGTFLSDPKIMIPPVIALVRGNNDLAFFSLKNPETGTLSSISAPSDVMLTAAGHKIFITHGHKYGIYAGIKSMVDEAKRNDAHAVLFGHTHTASYADSDGILALNPGSISLPRENQPKCFAKMYFEKGRKPSDWAFFTIKGEEILPFKYPLPLE